MPTSTYLPQEPALAEVHTKTTRSRPILFSSPMVRAILSDRKAQTRRVLATEMVLGREAFVAPRGRKRYAPTFLLPEGIENAVAHCPFGKPGDQLWVRETWAYGIHALAAVRDEEGPFVYAADGTAQGRLCAQWRPSIHMPRKVSRILLEITRVRIERLQDISEDDAISEGVAQLVYDSLPVQQCGEYDAIEADAIDLYQGLWERLHGPRSWDANPWVWCVEFKRIA